MSWIERHEEGIVSPLIEPWHNTAWMPFDPRLLPPEVGGFSTPPAAPVKWISAFPPGRITRALEREGLAAAPAPAPAPAPAADFLGIGTLAQAIPELLSAFGAHKGERKERHQQERLMALQEEMAAKERAARIREAQIEAEASARRWESATRLARPVGIGVGILGGIWGLTKAISWARARKERA